MTNDELFVAFRSLLEGTEKRLKAYVDLRVETLRSDLKISDKSLKRELRETNQLLLEETDRTFQTLHEAFRDIRVLKWRSINKADNTDELLRRIARLEARVTRLEMANPPGN